MELRHLIAPKGYKMPLDHVLEWRRVIGSNPIAGKKLIEEMPHLRRLSILSVLGDNLPFDKIRHLPPRDREECELLSAKCRQVLLEKGAKFDTPYATMEQKYKLYRYMGYDEKQMAVVASQLQGHATATMNRTTKLRLRDRVSTFNIDKLLRGVKYVLPLLTRDQFEFVIKDKTSAVLFTAVARLLPHEWLDIAANRDWVFVPSMGSKERVLNFVKKNPAFGQWALGNPRFHDKSEVLERWVSRYKYFEPYWFEDSEPYFTFMSPTHAVCDVTELPDRFFSEARLEAIKWAVNDLKKVSVIASERVTRKLRAMGLDRVYESWEYSNHQLNQNQRTLNKEVISDSGQVLQTSQGLH